jgi:L-arabinose isomerase
MMHTPRVGLLPLYLALYDEQLPEARTDLAAFLPQVQAALEMQGVQVTVAPICRVRGECARALHDLEASRIDLLVTLHLAYSPSLEAIETLCSTSVPVLLLDITPDLEFGREVNPARLMANHGIHGVQDLANLLCRRKRAFEIVAGHLASPPVLQRVEQVARAAVSARALRDARVLRVGPVFPGMGDFQVTPEVLRARLGIHSEEIPVVALASDVKAVTEEAMEAEVAADQAAFDVDCDPAVHRRSVRLGLGLRRCLERGAFTAFSMNFLAFDLPNDPITTVPFLECSKAMARGLGYAGEGDVLTAALVGALQAGIGPATFTEMFCPDWAGGTIFLSHMGEFNPALAAERPRLYEKPFPFTPALPPACLACAPTPGPATLVNLAPGPDDTFRLIIAPIEVLSDTTNPQFADWIRGWFRPARPVADFLEAYSRVGGTHHCALVLGDQRAALLSFARLIGAEERVIG